MLYISFILAILTYKIIDCLSFPTSSHLKRPSVELYSSSFQVETKYINGRRCLFSPAKDSNAQRSQPQQDNIINDLNENHSIKNFPLILIGGTAQTITSWEHHIGPLSRNRDVLVYECLGQGPYPTSNEIKDYFENVTLEKQANDIKEVIQTIFSSDQRVDIAGFSFGGRVAMAVAASYPKLIRKLHITGVGANRAPMAKLILQSWTDILRTTKQQYHSIEYNSILKESALIPFAWSSIMSTYSSSFLSKNEKRVPLWVQSISKQNTVEGILAILEQTHTEDENNEWHPISMAKRIVIGDSIQELQMAVGSLDFMATVKETHKLIQIFTYKESNSICEVHVYDGCGHAVMMEDARKWRTDLLTFLDK